MGRRPREEEEGGIYHVIQRGNNREYVFKEERDKEYLTGQLFQLNKTGCKIYGYVIMGNHYHLVLKTGSELLKSVMHRLNLRYSKYYNKENSRSGHVFQGRYKAVLVRDEKYILSLLRYVHQNPVKAGICSRMEDYRWSSDMFYRQNKSGWIDTDLVLEMLSGNKKIALEKYKEFMSTEETVEYESIKAIGKTGKTEPVSEEAKAEVGEKRKTLDEILQATGVNDEEYRMIKKGSRKRALTGYKLRYAKEALEFNYTLKAIGENIKISDVAILDMFRRNNLVT